MLLLGSATQVRRPMRRVGSGSALQAVTGINLDASSKYSEWLPCIARCALPTAATVGVVQQEPGL